MTYQSPTRRLAFFIATASLVALFSFSASPALASVPPWSAPVTVADAYGDAKASAVAPDGTITIATETAAGIATVTSTDAGATWAPAVLVGSGGEFAFRPAIGVTSSGLLAASWVEETAGVRAIYVVISANNGAIWSAPVALPTVISSVDDPVVASSSASGFTIAWSEGFDKLASSSVDAGVTWSAAQVLTQAMNSYGTASLIPHGAGQIVVIFQEFDGPTALYSIQSKRSSDGGVSWGAIVPVSGSWSGSLGNGLYAVGVSPSAGNVVAVWSRGVIGGDGLFATTSSDGGATWDSPFSVFSPADSLRYFDVQEISATSAGVVWHYELGADSVLGYSTVDIGASAASAPVTINHTLTSYYDRLPSLSTLDSVRVVSWYEDGATEATSGYRVSASCDAGVTWTAPSALAIGPDISSASAVTVVSGSVFTGLWGEQDSGPSGQSLRAASSSDPCTAVAAANPMLATTGVEITPLVIFAFAMFSLGVGLHALRRRSAV